MWRAIDRAVTTSCHAPFGSCGAVVSGGSITTSIRAGGRSTIVGRLAARASRRGRARRAIVLATLRRVPLSRCLGCNFTVDAEWRIDGRVVVDNSRGFLLFISDLDTFVSAGAPARALSFVRSDCLSLDSRSIARLREFTAPHVVVDENALCIDWGNALCAIVGQQIRLAVGGGDVTGLWAGSAYRLGSDTRARNATRLR
ncbi:hypothetical protein GQ600_19241 [Phytophthora cactorum]|nr:hypothetical protein GQ600_19241 [Phytophthora cactorum]